MASPNTAEIQKPPRPSRTKLYTIIAALAALSIATAASLLKHPNILSLESILSAPDETSFIEVPQILINFNDRDGMKILRFSGQLEVMKKDQSSVTSMMPRIVDAMNGYLRGLDAEMIEEPGALFQIRNDLLLRTQILTGEDLVNKFLIKEFIIQ